MAAKSIPFSRASLRAAGEATTEPVDSTISTGAFGASTFGATGAGVAAAFGASTTGAAAPPSPASTTAIT